MPVFCKDCKHSRPGRDDSPYSLTCESPQNFVQYQADEKYLVTGIVQPTMTATRGANCVALRSNRDAETLKIVCGPDGKWFEAK